jgi:hypothetical protein
MSWCRAHSWTCDQILLPVGRLLSEICGLVSVGLPLWRGDGSAIFSVITQWSESSRTHNHTLLSHLRLPQPGRPGSSIYIPQEQGGPVIPPSIVFPLCRFLRLAGLRWGYSIPAAGQLDYDFPCFSLVSERVLSWYPNSTLHCMLLMQPSKY